MKKLKLLSSLSALLLVLSVGACDHNVTEDSSSDEVTSSESDSSTSSSESTPAPVELSNYTISITLKDEEGNAVAIPFYDSVYIIGDWDNWTEFIALTETGDESGSVLTTTLDTIKEGSHEFKGLIGNQDDTPSWSLTELILAEDGKGNATFEVAASEGDNATKSLEFTVDATKIPVLDETPMTDEEIAQAILDVAYNEDSWSAIYGEHYDESDDSFQVIYVTTDSDDVLYGVIREYDDYDPDDGLVEASLNSEYFYVDGVEYTHNLNSDNYDTEDDETYFNFGDYDELYDDFAAGLTTLSYIENVSDLASWSIIHEDESSLYTLSVVNTTTDNLICRRAGDAFTIVRAEEIDNTNVFAEESYAAEPTTAATIEAQMGGFSRWDWDVAAENPSELAEKAAFLKNYSVQIEYDIYTGSNTLTYGEYNRYYEIYYGLLFGYDPDTYETLTQGSDRYNELYEEFQSIDAKFDALTDDLSVESYIADIYYTEDSVHYIESIYDEETEDYVPDGYEVIYVNDPDVGIWEYVTHDSFETVSIYYGTAGHSWWNYTYSLVVGYSYADYLEYYTSYTGQDVYYFNDFWEYYYGVSFYWFCYLGGELFFEDYYTAWYYMAYNFVEEGTYFDESEQMMTTMWSTAGYGNLISDDDTLTDDSELYLYEEDMYVTVYDVGQTVEDEKVSCWHNYWQNYLANQG